MIGLWYFLAIRPNQLWNEVGDVHMDAELISLIVLAHTLGILKLIDETFSVILPLNFALELKYLIKKFSPMLVMIRLENVETHMYFPIDGTCLALLRTRYCEKADGGWRWLMARPILLKVRPIAGLQTYAPQHSVMGFEDATLDKVSDGIIARPIEKYVGLYVMQHPQKCQLAIGLNSPEYLLVTEVSRLFFYRRLVLVRIKQLDDLRIL